MDHSNFSFIVCIGCQLQSPIWNRRKESFKIPLCGSCSPLLYAGSAGDLFETKFWCSVLVSYLPLVFEDFYLYIHTLRLNHVKISQNWVTYGWATQLHFMNFYQGAGDLPSCGKTISRTKHRQLHAGRKSLLKPFGAVSQKKTSSRKACRGRRSRYGKVSMEWDNVMGDKGRVSASPARVTQLLHKLKQSCLLIVAFKDLPFGSNQQRLFLDMSLWRNILEADYP